MPHRLSFFNCGEFETFKSIRPRKTLLGQIDFGDKTETFAEKPVTK
jgi:hypothetical protein